MKSYVIYLFTCICAVGLSNVAHADISNVAHADDASYSYDATAEKSGLGGIEVKPVKSGVNPETLQIMCDNLRDELCDDENGWLLNPYFSHIFYLPSDISETVTNPCWTLYATQDGSEVKIDEGGAFTYSMPELASLATNRELNLNNDRSLNCTLEFTGYVGENLIKPAPLQLYIEFNPRIIDADITEIEYSEDDRSFKAHYKVWYTGADMIDVTSEYQYSSVAESQTYYEPYCIEGVSNWILGLFKSWINFTAFNSTESDTLRIEFDKGATSWHVVDPNGSNLSQITGIESDAEEILGYEVYDATGLPVWSGAELQEFVSGAGNKGIFIVKALTRTGSISHCKIMK